jgi:Uma2 family endonuclease
MADNTRQFRTIVMIQGGLDDLFRDRQDVFVASDNLWYPVEGRPEIRTAPDVYVAFGRPKGDRGSYKQWEEDNIPPQVVFEVLSPGNRAGEMTRKFRFYERYGVDEYYLYDPDTGALDGWLRTGAVLDDVPNMVGFVSPRLGVRFELADGELRLLRPDGQRFLTYLELAAQREAERQRAEQERQLNEKFATKLREMGVDPDQL